MHTSYWSHYNHQMGHSSATIRVPPLAQQEGMRGHHPLRKKGATSEPAKLLDLLPVGGSGARLGEGRNLHHIRSPEIRREEGRWGDDMYGTEREGQKETENSPEGEAVALLGVEEVRVSLLINRTHGDTSCGRGQANTIHNTTRDMYIPFSTTHKHAPQRRPP